ncbi:tetratricopeptide repeat protein [Filimonas effusa]|uniref:Tetratricopeptide repeat protein n=1 Tax=Filimonas effusa TaxID=2508721 RepID=A0A4Q1D501_9BACT|nr:tetratricopeptide repeat protein [Filimonas effusa]RXK83509.1 tetratricopeptide repeat protein [Filimonas effusa]
MNRPRIHLTWIFCLLTCSLVIAQDSEFKRDLEKAKEEMKLNGVDEQPDYNRAIRLLESALAKNDKSAEAWYFYGYALDRLNSADGDAMIRQQLKLTIKSSEAFEKAIAISNDVYTGELLTLDPHTKILTVWGSQAIRYAYDNKPDSSYWALKQASERGGINSTVLQYFRQVLEECSRDAFLFTNGDMYLHYLNYLQTIEKYRTDVNCVDLNLLNARWYPGWLVKKNRLPVSIAPADLEKLDIVRWDVKVVNIQDKNPAHSDTGISWKLWPTYGKKYMLRADRILLNVLQQNAFKKDVFFPGDVPPVMSLFLTDYLECNGLTNKLVTDSLTTELSTLIKRLRKLKYIPSYPKTYLNNRDNIQVLNNYRFTYATAVNLAMKEGKIAIAKDLAQSVQHKYPETTLPFFTEETRKWFQELEKKTEEKAKLE